MTVQKRLLHSLLFCLLICIYSCDQNSYKFVKIKEYSFQFDSIDKTFANIYIDNNDEYLVLLNDSEKTIEIQSINDHELKHSIPIEFLYSASGRRSFMPSRFFIHSPDSIFILLLDDITIGLINNNGYIVKKWKVTDFYESKYEYILNASFEMPLMYSNERIFIQIASIINDPSPQNRDLLFYSMPQELIIDISVDPPIITNNTCTFPKPYQDGKHYYSDYFPSRIINNENLLIYSFKRDHNLYVYDTERLVDQVNAISDFYDYFNEYDRESTDDLAGAKEYVFTEPQYFRLIYDQFRDIYYRIFLHRMEYENPDGTINNKKKWSIIVLNSNMEMMNEIVMDHELYYTTRIYPIKDGVLIQRKQSKNDRKIRKIDFDLLKILTN